MSDHQEEEHLTVQLIRILTTDTTCSVFYCLTTKDSSPSCPSKSYIAFTTLPEEHKYMYSVCESHTLKVHAYTKRKYKAPESSLCISKVLRHITNYAFEVSCYHIVPTPGIIETILQVVAPGTKWNPHWRCIQLAHNKGAFYHKPGLFHIWNN